MRTEAMGPPASGVPSSSPKYAKTVQRVFVCIDHVIESLACPHSNSIKGALLLDIQTKNWQLIQFSRKSFASCHKPV